METVEVVLVALVAAEVLAAAVIDARTRTFPPVLMIPMAVTCLVCAYALGGFDRMLFGLVAAVFACLPLAAFEILWRRAHDGAPGLGMGDVKFLAVFTVVWPLGALLSFAGGLALLAVAGVALKRSSLPLLPFVAAAAPLVALAV